MGKSWRQAPTSPLPDITRRHQFPTRENAINLIPYRALAFGAECRGAFSRVWSGCLQRSVPVSDNGLSVCSCLGDGHASRSRSARALHGESALGRAAPATQIRPPQPLAHPESTHPDDARAPIARNLQYHRETFGNKPPLTC